jgi:phenylpyruvate tautomerase
MPYLYIQTNLHVPQQQYTQLLVNSSRAVAKILGKSESGVVIALQTEVPMLFAGSNEPCAYLMLENVKVPFPRTDEFAYKLCSFMEESLNIAKSRIYVKFANQSGLWGWRGKVL